MNPHLPQTLEEQGSFVRALARSLVVDPQGADDLAQDAWVVALVHPPRHSTNLRGWFGTVVHRLAGQARASADHRSRREARAARHEAQGDASELIVQQETLRRVFDAVLALEQPYQETVLLRYYHGLSPGEIAARTNVSIATVRGRLQRALERLRERLDRASGGDREAWCRGLVPLLGAGKLGKGGAVGSLVGGWGVLVMAAKMKSAVILGALAVGALIVFVERRAWQPTDQSVGEGLVAGNHAESEQEKTPAALVQNASESNERAPAVADPPEPAETTGGIEVRITYGKDGRPAAGEPFRLLLFGHPPGDRRREGITNADGMFELYGLLPGSVAVISAHGAEESKDVIAGETTQFYLHIPVGFSARGKVVDPSGMSVPNARLWLSEFGNYRNGFIVAESGADGGFEIQDIPQSRYLGAIASGYAPSHLHYLPQSQPSGDAYADVDLTLNLNGPGGRLAVELTGPNGDPVAEAFVRVTGARPHPIQTEKHFLLSFSPTFDARSDEHGFATIEGLPFGQSQVQVWAPGMAIASSSKSIERDGISILRITLQQEGVVAGRVLTPGNLPASGAMVALAGEYDPMMPRVQTDEEGRYQLRSLPIGSVQLVARSENMGRAETQLTLSPGIPSEWDPVLASGRILQGEVLDENDLPLSAWFISAVWPHERKEVAQARTDEAGHFRMINAPAGDLELVLFRDPGKERFATQRRPVASTENEIVFRVKPSELAAATLIGKAVDGHGAAVAGASVYLRTELEDGTPTWETDSGGSFKIEHVSPGRYDLSLSSPSLSGRHLGVIEIGQEVVDLGTFVLDPPGRVRITVSGRPAAEATAIESYNFREIAPSSAFGWSEYFERDKLGEVVTLSAGRYLLRTRGALGFADAQIELQVLPDAEVALDLDPHAGRPVSLNITMSDADTPSDPVQLRVRDAAGVVWMEDTRWRDGAHPYGWSMRLEPGRYVGNRSGNATPQAY